ncbi:hypothetical protein GF324_09140 [bacterium]|nr:hypothetical protein [bacterium]
MIAWLTEEHLKRSMRAAFLLSTAFLVLLAISGELRSSEVSVPPYGAELPFMQSWGADDYGGGTQNWDIVQDSSDLILVANDSGILTYDGARWGRVGDPEHRPARSFLRDRHDRIWVGMLNDFGYLSSDSTGSLRIVSLLHLLPEEHHGFHNVDEIHETERGLVMVTRSALMFYHVDPDQPDDGVMEVYPTPEDDPIVSYCNLNDRHLVFVFGQGLLECSGGGYQPVAGHDRIEAPVVWDLTPLGGDSLLLNQGDDGHAVFHNGVLKPLENEATRYLRALRPTNETLLPDGRIAAVTRKGGLVLFDYAGTLHLVMNRDNGLRDNWVVNGPLIDNTGGYWLTLNDGVARLEIDAPLRVVHDDVYMGAVLSMVSHNGRLFAGADQGIYRLRSNMSLDDTSNWERIAGIDNRGWDLLNMDNRLLIGAASGVYELVDGNGRCETVSFFNNALDLESSPDGRFLYVGTWMDGLQVLERAGAGWGKPVRVPGTSDFVRGIFVEPNGALWLTIEGGYPETVRLPSTGNVSDAVVTVYDSSRGLAEPGSYIPFLVNGRIHVASEQGTFYLDDDRTKFVPDSLLALYPGQPSEPTDWVSTDDKGRIWFSAGPYATWCAIPDSTGTGYKMVRPFARARVRESYLVLPVPEENHVWMGSADGRVIRWDECLGMQPGTAGRAKVRQVYIQNDSLLFGGYGEVEKLRLQSNHRVVRINFSLPQYDAVELNRYRYRLLPRHRNWSSWSEEAYRDLGRLPGGSYTIEVQGRDAYGRVSKTDPFTFQVQHPWYLSIWSVLLAASAIVALIYGFMQWRFRAMERRRLLLKKLVAKRTRELEEAMRELELHRDAELEAKQMRTAARLGATLAHEFNNPLAIIKAGAELAKMQDQDERTNKILDSILRQTERLSELVRKFQKLEELREIDYAAGMKILDIHGPEDSDQKSSQPEEA